MPTTRGTTYPAGWTCELIVVRFERYLMRSLPRGEALAVAEHIEVCAWCAERVTMLWLAVGVDPEATAGRRVDRTRSSPQDTREWDTL